MAILGQSWLNMIDVVKRSDPKIGMVIELLHQSNEILEDAITVECNNGSKHKHGVRTGLPAVAWGALYKGIPQSKSAIQSVEDATGFVEGMSSVDKRLLDIYPDEDSQNRVRFIEGAGFLEALNQEMATGLFYHSTKTSPEKFDGLATRYSAYATGSFNQGIESQVINGGASGADNTSIWMVTWGDMYTHMLYPKGSKAGIIREDKGEQRVLDAAGNPFFVMEELYRWNIGLAVKDWRYNVRIANIDVSDSLAGTVDLYKLLTTAYYRLQKRRKSAGSKHMGGNTVIYANRTILEALDNLATGVGAAANSKLNIMKSEIQGQEVLTWRGIPIRETDAILNTEALVPAAS
jgi:hypothetical protein